MEGGGGRGRHRESNGDCFAVAGGVSASLIRTGQEGPASKAGGRERRRRRSGEEKLGKLFGLLFY